MRCSSVSCGVVSVAQPARPSRPRPARGRRCRRPTGPAATRRTRSPRARCPAPGWRALVVDQLGDEPVEGPVSLGDRHARHASPTAAVTAGPVPGCRPATTYVERLSPPVGAVGRPSGSGRWCWASRSTPRSDRWPGCSRCSSPACCSRWCCAAAPRSCGRRGRPGRRDGPRPGDARSVRAGARPGGGPRRCAVRSRTRPATT